MRTNISKTKGTLLASVGAVSLTLFSPAFAQDAPSSEAAVDDAPDTRRLDVISVTARKVEESLQDAPLSIAAFSSEALETRGIQDLTEIARATAGFSYEDFNGSLGAPTIRAQTQIRVTNPVQNVASFYNGVYLQRGYMIDQSLLNVAQVEVLRGPQSAALGRNAFAGAITYTTKKAGEEPEFGLDISVGEDDYLKYQFEGSTQLIPGVLSGIAGYSYSEYDGGWENGHALANASGARTSGNVGGYENEAYMIGLNFTPIDGLEVNGTYLNNRTQQEGPAQYTVVNSTFDSPVGLLNCGAPAPFGGLSLFCGEFPVEPIIADSTTNGTTRQAGIVIDPRSGQDLPSEIYTLSVDYEFSDQWSASYIYGKTQGEYTGAGASNYDQETGATSFFTGLIPIDPTGNGSLESDSHEVRVDYTPNDSVTAYAGAYTSESTDGTLGGVGVLVPAQTTGPLVQPEFPDSSAYDFFDTEVMSFFGFLAYETGPWSLSAEARYTEEEFSDDIDTVSLDYFTPRLTAGYALTDVNRVYVSYATGTKAGGLNPIPADGFFDPSQRFYDEEENTTYEIGSRNEFLDGDLILNGTVYYIEAEGLQVSESRILPPGSTEIAPTVVGNLGESETVGVEIEANWYPNENLAVYAAYGFANAEFSDGTFDQRSVSVGLCDDIVCPADGSVGGNQLPRSPETTFNAGFLWENDLFKEVDYFVGADLGYQSKQFGNSVNTNWISDRTIIDASIGVRKGGIEFKLTADNLLDEEYVSSAFDIAFGTSPFFGSRSFIPFLGDRRRVAMNLSLDF